MPESGETLELEVTVGGTTHLVQYCIETLQWGADVTTDDRFEHLRMFIQNYESNWSLVQIGSPGEGTGLIMFRQRHATAEAPEGDE